MSISVSPEAAALLRDADRVEAAGRLVDTILFPPSRETDLLAPLIAEVKAEARSGGLTDADIDAELAASEGEKRH